MPLERQDDSQTLPVSPALLHERFPVTPFKFLRRVDSQVDDRPLGEMEGPNKRNPAVGLADELIVEILLRLPIRSLCRFRCVSKSWRALISHRHHLKTLPQTLAGFFYTSFSADRCPMMTRHFTNVSGRGLPLIYPSFSFLPKCEDILPLDCCKGLVLCRCWESSSLGRDGPSYYAVCNPATEKWVVLPEVDGAGEARVACLGFDPAVSSHFHVFEFLENKDEYLTGVEGDILVQNRRIESQEL